MADQALPFVLYCFLYEIHKPYAHAAGYARSFADMRESTAKSMTCMLLMLLLAALISHVLASYA